MARIQLHVKFAACVILVAAHGLARGDAYRLPYQGAAAAGQAEAFAAQADDPSALFYNPAGITQLDGFQVYAGTNLVGGQVDFRNAAGADIYGDVGGTIAVPPPSNLYFTANLKGLGFTALGPLSVGLGVSSPYGLITRYPRNGPFSDVVISAKLPLMDIKPTIAYRVADWVSLGFGLDVYTFASFLAEGQYQLKRRLPEGGAAELAGSGTGLGYNMSVMLTPFRNGAGQPQLNLGFVYRSQTNLPLSGHYRFNGLVADAETNLPLPDVVTGAVAFWPLRDQAHEWKLEYDMEFVGWDRFRSFDVRLPYGIVDQTPEHWKTVWTASFGTEYRWLDPAWLPQWEIAVRAGYQHSNTPVPDYTFSPVVPDSDWNIAAFGVGFTCKTEGRFLGVVPCGNGAAGSIGPKSIGLDLAFQAAFFDPRTIASNYQESVIGKYSTMIYIGSLNLRVAF